MIIRLTVNDGEPVFVNTDNVQAYEPMNSTSGSRVIGLSRSYYVQESIDEIMRKLLAGGVCVL